SKLEQFDTNLISVGEVLESKIEHLDFFFSAVSDISSILEVINSNLDILEHTTISALEKLDAEIISVSDSICSKFEIIDQDIVHVGNDLHSLLDIISNDAQQFEHDVLSKL